MDTFVNAPGELAVRTFLLITMYVTMYMNLSTGHMGIILWGTFRERTFQTSEARFERKKTPLLSYFLTTKLTRTGRTDPDRVLMSFWTGYNNS